MTRLVPALVPLAVASLMLTACGDADDKDDTTPSARAGDAAESSSASDDPDDTGSTGGDVTGDGYAFDAPDGWIDITDEVKANAPQVDQAVGEPAAEIDGARDNINVVVTPSGGTTVEGYEELAPDALAFMIPELEILPRRSIAGEEAAHVAGEATSGGATFFMEQFAVTVDGDLFAITFTHDNALSPAQRDAVVDPVLASWEWS